MLDAFDALREQVSEKRFFAVLATNGIENAGELGMNNPGTLTAYRELLAEQPPATEQSRQSKPQADFRPRRGR